MRTFREYLTSCEALSLRQEPDPPPAAWHAPDPEDHWAGNTPQQVSAWPGFRKKDFGPVPGLSFKKGVYSPKKTLGIPRVKMPQAKSRADLLDWLRTQNVHLQLTMVAPADPRIRFAQAAIYREKAANFIRKGKSLEKPIILSKDFVIFDGNHHWLALRRIKGDTAVPMYVADIAFKPLKKLVVTNYPNVMFEESTQWGLDTFQEFVLRQEQLTPSDSGTAMTPKKNVSYTGLVLDPASRAKLVAELNGRLGGAADWKEIAHHATICLGPLQDRFADLSSIGQTFAMTATHFAMDAKVAAVRVTLPGEIKSVNAVPHVTLACNYKAGGQPKNSNDLTEWQPLAVPISLVGILTEIPGK